MVKRTISIPSRQAKQDQQQSQDLEAESTKTDPIKSYSRTGPTTANPIGSHSQTGLTAGVEIIHRDAEILLRNALHSLKQKGMPNYQEILAELKAENLPFDVDAIDQSIPAATARVDSPYPAQTVNDARNRILNFLAHVDQQKEKQQQQAGTTKR